MAPTTNKSKPPARDFAKRPRAKVGKRAPAKVNATDTSFKTATVAVRPQGQSLDKGRQQPGKDAALSSAKRMELFSSRGNTLATLQMSLRHHAAPVRASGLKGIRDAVQSLSSLDVAIGVAILEANLPSLLPHLCRCWLDEDDDVRSLALNLYGDILKCLSSYHESADLNCLAPFVPFFCAYASSALNSLDRSIRIDGSSIVALLASSVQSPSFSQLMSSSSTMSAMARELSHHVDALLPSMERLLTSVSLGRRASNSGRNTESQKSNTSAGQKRNMSGKNAPSAQTKLSSKRDSRESTTAQSILLSLAFLLKASIASNDDLTGFNHVIRDKTQRDLLPSLHVSGECSFIKGGSAQSNSLLLIRDMKGSRAGDETRIHSIRDLPAIQDEVSGSSTNVLVEDDISTEEFSSMPKDKDAKTMENVQQMTSLLETLRGKFVEIAHLGKKTDLSGLMSSPNDLEAMDVLVELVRLSHSRFLSYYQTISKHHQRVEVDATATHKREKGGKKSTKDLQTVQECLVAYQASVDRVLQLLLENFPVKSFGETTNPERYEFTNACICSALAELGGGVLFDDGKKKTSPWVNTVSSYVLPRLTCDEDSYESKTDDGSYSESISTNMLLKVVTKLLLPLGKNSGDNTKSYLLSNTTKRQEILKAFAKAFFPQVYCPSGPQHVIYASSSTVELERKIKNVAKTAAGRTACMMVTKLVAQSADSLFNDSTDTEYATLLLQLISVLPTYLVAWESKYPVETGLVLASILSVVRQWHASGNASGGSKEPVAIALEELCLGLRYSLEALYIPIESSPAGQQPKKKRKKASIKQSCILEGLPGQVQKLAIGLAGLLQSPTDVTAKQLSRICSKARIAQILTSNGEQEYEAISLDMANYIREVMHLSRRSMPMPNYLSFLLDGSGIELTTGISLLQKQSLDNLFLYDSEIDQLSRFLTTCCDKASQKVLPMLRPILEKWLSAPTKIDEKEGASNETMRLLVQGRAAISILSAFTWDDVLSYNSIDNDVVPSTAMDDELDQSLLNCILSLCEFWSKGNYFDDTESQQLYLAKLLGPVTVLLRYRRGMLKQFLEAVSKRVADQSTSETVVEIYMKAILMILKSKDPVLMTSMIQHSDDLQKVLLSVAKSMETIVSGGPLAHLGGKLQHNVKTICST